ncbi:uncharacterized protein CHSO_1048 [Chryseobacterium sp. StRB126]|uniref:helix-turn-helix domain-containing protein n=1 Tax=Chryseobacterium sp. StRB126 TaxID=878220 RepID=UPI0004E99DAD|nr:helix-turn-helix transcriptional regulator [Chryseobacterium sp. StRB126]BAP30085.1 uncharacterized protein CHSO_1048 [Chryseobacterium sp. StRB126]
MNGKKLKEIRKELGLTQTELAKLIGRTTMRTVQNWESDKNAIPDYVDEFLKNEIHQRHTPNFVSNNSNTDFKNLSVDDKLNYLFKQNEQIIKENEELKDMVDDLTLKIEISLAPILRHFKLNADSKEKNNNKSSIN